ncbi:MAG TPA: hypothetical protein PLL78_02230 [Fimbriimonadaceae bacterium]|nr:hypothetical protein [Fimbriimonadaceae bacterium]HRJ95477.1 hypothetical protein [Fimbriimonadaceae bacterium]
MAPPILRPPIQKKTPWGLIIGIVVGVLLIAGIGIRAFVYWIVSSEKSVPMSESVRTALFTLEDVDRWVGEPWSTVGKESRSVTEEVGKTRRAEYEYDADDLYVWCQLEYGGVGSWAIDSLDYGIAKRLAPKGIVDSLDYREDSGYFKWGEDSWFSHIHNDKGERIGFYLIAYSLEMMITVQVVGIDPETPEEMSALLKPALEECWALDRTLN